MLHFRHVSLYNKDLTWKLLQEENHKFFKIALPTMCLQCQKYLKKDSSSGEFAMFGVYYGFNYSVYVLT